jgi:hypothetical protein
MILCRELVFDPARKMISPERRPLEFRCESPFRRYAAAVPKHVQVIYTAAGERVNSFVYRVLINTNTEI